MSRCQWPDGMEIRPDGVHRLDPCTYDVIEEHQGVTVRVLRCSRCGHQEIEWEQHDGDYAEGWLPVNSVMPLSFDDVLVCGFFGEMSVAYVVDGEFTAYAGDGKTIKVPGVVAWRPLPKPYGEEA